MEKNNLKKEIIKKTKPRVSNAKKGKKTKKEDFEFKKSKLKIIPLGGLHEIGKNITVFEYENEMIAVDCGVSFPEDDMLGVDLVIPDITYIVNNKEKFKGTNIWNKIDIRFNKK